MAVAALLILLLAGGGWCRDFTIQKFQSTITIREDASFTVKETLMVEFHRPRHGIYREIPFRYADELGKTMITPLSVLSVTDAAEKDWNYRVTRQGNIIHIRIGDAKKYVTGLQTYVITYQVQNALLFFEDHDELYWNVTGNYWKVPIKEAQVTVSLVTSRKSMDLRGTCFTGILGSRESECTFEPFENLAVFSSKKVLNPGEGLTVALGWDKGLVTPPSLSRSFLWSLNLKENWVFILPFLALFYMFFHWKRRGRDPRVRESVMVRYEPPTFNQELLRPGEAGVLLDEKVDPRDITSTLVDLAVRGYIRIEEIKKEGLIFDSTDYNLTRLKGPDQALIPFEKLLLESLFSGAQAVLVSALKNNFYKHLELLKITLYKELVDKKYFLRGPEKVRKFYLTAGVLIILFGGMLSFFLFPDTQYKGILAWVLSGIPILAFSWFMPAKTRTGALAFMDILGFQEFLNRAEKDRIERLGDKNLFFKYLPYAMALDVVDGWAKAFEGIYQEPPDWYVSPGGFRTFSPYSFSRSISSVGSTLATAMFSAPRGSGSGGGFGGGGSSGGGFGGGGGGSW
jgi:uncharacterized membrane protein